MARTIEITVPADESEELVSQLSNLPLIAGVQLQRSGSVSPPADIVTVRVSNTALHPVIRLLSERRIGVKPGTSYSVTENVALVEGSLSPVLLRESTDSSWEEIHQVLAKESNMTINALLLLAVAGLLAAIGISTGAVHVVIAAMVIAPGFEPISRVSLGLIAGGSALQRGLTDTLKAYLALLAGSVLAAALLPLMGRELLGGSGAYVVPESLVAYWTNIGPASLVISLFAGIAGGILVAINRTVLTAGVMIGLSLIPAAALIGVGLVAGDLSLASRALLRWLLDVALVTGASLLVFWWKLRTVQKRKANV